MLTKLYFLANWSGKWPFPAQVQGIIVAVYTLFKNGHNFSILLFTCKLNLLPRLRENILLNFKFKNEATRANLQENKRILKWRPFWNKVN